MRRALSGVGWLGVSLLLACSSNETGKGSQVGQSMAGSSGSGGEAGGLTLVGISGAGMGGGGTAGTAGAGGANGGAGSGSGGTTSAGSNPGGSGSGGSKPAGMCKRAPGSDADCTDFFEMPSQAYSCDDRSAYFTLNDQHGGKCGNGNFVAGAPVGACCPP